MSNERKEPESNQPRTQSQSTGYWIAAGLAIGAGIGVALDNLVIGLGIGIAIGATLSAAQAQRNNYK